MVDAILEFLKSSGLVILDCRGQSYDNVKNMSGIYQCVPIRTLALNPLAVFVPCSAHSLNRNFRVNIFYATLDIVIAELQSRTDSYEKVLQLFNFLFHLDTDNDDDIR